MNALEYSLKILEELQQSLKTICPEEAETLIDQILKTSRIFVSGAGRSKLMIKCFAMRLMHFGFEVHVVGETTTPAIRSGDLLIVASGSGETDTITLIVKKAKKAGAVIAAVTIKPDSTIGRLAEHVVRINANTMKSGIQQIESVQIGGNTFEQSLLIFLDAVVLRIIERREISDPNAQLKRSHANLE